MLNVGDLMEIYTNGVFPSTRHRVVIPEEEVLRRRSRQSIAVFIQPDNDVVPRPLGLGSGEEPAKIDYMSGLTTRQRTFKRYASTYKQ